MKKIILLLATVCTLGGCSKENREGSGNTGNLRGTLYFEWANEGTLGYNTANGTPSTLLPYDTRRNGWDVSFDNNLVLVAKKADAWNDDIQFTLSRIADGTIVHQFNYTPLKGGSGYGTGILSPDHSLIAIPPSFEEGFVILKTDGSLVAHIEDLNGEKIERGEQIAWLPGNELLMTHKNYIIRLPAPYSSGSLVKEMNQAEWGDLAVNPQGTKIAVTIMNHIWMMNIDGGDLVQVTESNDKEVRPTFSPDGKHLLVGTNYTPVAPMGAIWYLKIIPADGKKYSVDSNQPNSPEVIAIPSENGRTGTQAASEDMRWR